MLRHPAASLCALAAVWLFALVAGSWWPAADARAFGWFHADEGPAIAGLAGALTDLGGWLVLFLATLAGAAALLANGRRRDAALLLVVTQGGRAMVELQKAAIGRVRPSNDQADLIHSLSFPSGHSANSMITALMLALLLAGGRKWPIAAALGFSFAIGCTRLILGVHWPTDVLGGWAFGAFWVLAVMRGRVDPTVRCWRR